MKHLFLLGTAFAAVLALTGTSFAHSIWLAERHGQLTLVYGHGASDEAYDPAKFIETKAWAADGSAHEIIPVLHEDYLTFAKAEGSAVVTASFDNGFWTKSGEEWINKPRSQVSGGGEAGHYIKYTTAILSHLAGPAKPHGLDFEIVPLLDPLTLRAGEALPVQVLHQGKPVAGVELIAEYATASADAPTVTDADGKATITVRNQGLNIVVANLTVPTPGNVDGDEIGLTASLSFSLGHGEE